jgi:hypothetical protein
MMGKLPGDPVLTLPSDDSEKLCGKHILIMPVELESSPTIYDLTLQRYESSMRNKKKKCQFKHKKNCLNEIQQ